MVFLYFGSDAFNYKSSESSIRTIIVAKEKYGSPQDFFESAIAYIDEEIDTEDDIRAEYDGAYLKEGLYEKIIKQWISSMDKKIEIAFNNIIKTYRIKRTTYDPNIDEFVLETEDEYILFLWATSA